MLDLSDVYYYARVVEHQGITAAARALDVPKSSISRRILVLEASLGARLIQRTSRRFVVTEIGAEFHRHALAPPLKVARPVLLLSGHLQIARKGVGGPDAAAQFGKSSLCLVGR